MGRDRAVRLGPEPPPRKALSVSAPHGVSIPMPNAANVGKIYQFLNPILKKPGPDLNNGSISVALQERHTGIQTGNYHPCTLLLLET